MLVWAYQQKVSRLKNVAEKLKIREKHRGHEKHRGQVFILDRSEK